jgi:hypothetical protein
MKTGSTRNYERHLDKAFQFMNDNGYEAVKVVTLDPFYLLANTITANLINHYQYVVEKQPIIKL